MAMVLRTVGGEMMDIKPRQCIAALNAHVRSGSSLIGDAEISVRAKDVIETIQQLVLKLNEANKAYEASEVDSGFEALTAYHHGYQAGMEAAQPKWVSADEPPKQDVTYIVFIKTDNGKTFRGQEYYDAFNGWCCEGWYDGRHVAYWMPFESLPEPPKEEV